MTEKVHHDRSAHDLNLVAIGSTVTYYNHLSRVWLVGRVTGRTHDRAYLIETESGQVVSRNRRDIRPTSLTFKPQVNVKLVPSKETKPGKVSVSEPPKPPTPVRNVAKPATKCPTPKRHGTNSGGNSGNMGNQVTRSGRVVKQPKRLDL